MRNGTETFRKAFPQAQSLWFAKIPHTKMTTEAFALGKSIVIIQEYGNGDGWNAFTPTTDEGRVDLTLEAIGRRCGEPFKLSAIMFPEDTTTA